MMALRELSNAERLDWLRLARTDQIGPRTFAGLLTHFGSAGAALEALPNLGGRAVKPAPLRDAEAELAASRKAGIRLIAMCEPAYPPALRAIDAAPPLLTVRGNPAILQRPMTAIVGARNASGAGLLMTERLAAAIGRAGYAIVSGLARGIDARAHTASLETGTIAVLAGGQRRIYPAEHEGLAARIAEQGAIVSEMPIDWEPRGRDFPRRNRIVSGLALGTVVVEAARRSGSLITARFAGEQGREVFAVPGSPLDPRAEGTNDLLRQGATFCTGADDVIEALRPMREAPAGPLFTLREPSGGRAEPLWDDGPEGPDLFDEAHVVEASELADPGRVVAGLVGAAPVSIDDLVRLSGLSTPVVLSILTELELTGAIVRHGTGLVVAAVARDRGP